MISKIKTQLEYYNRKVKEEEVIRAEIEAATGEPNHDESIGEVFDLRKTRGKDFGLLDD